MAARIAIVTDYSGQRTASILADLQEWHATLDARVISPLRRRHPSRAAARPGPASVLGALLGYRPHLVICETAGWTGLQAAMYRQASRRSRLLLAFAGTSGETGPADPLDAAGDVGWVSRSITRASDGWWGEDGAVAQAIERLRLPASPAAPVTAELDPFFACARSRSEAEARRIVFAGELSPQSGAADLLVAVAGWAEQNQRRPVDLWWVGEGDLAGVLDAQPLPSGMTQRFLGRQEPDAMARIFAQCGLLAVPSLVDDRRAAVAEGLAAGLPIIGSRRDRNVRRWVRDDVNGWLFDALRPEEMAGALGRALDTPLGTLEQMRDRAQAAVRPAAKGGLTERLARALAAVPAEFPAKALADAAP